LPSLTDFEQNWAGELASIRIKALEEGASALGQGFLAIWNLEESDRHTVLSRYVRPPEMLGRPVSITVMARPFRDARRRGASYALRWPVAYLALDEEYLRRI
jgi:hypothetical protein